MNDNEKYFFPAGSTAQKQFDTQITAKDAGWEFSSLRIAKLAAGEALNFDTGAAEILVLPLCGSAIVAVDGTVYSLDGRESVFTSVSDYIYLPRGKKITLTATKAGRFALPGAKSTKDLPVRYCPASEVNSGIRGTGSCSRQVNNYALGNTVETSHLLVTEVLTPGGNWSSYPPHKHDAHSENERILEEIYYYELRNGGPQAATAGFGLQRVYSSPGKEIDVCTEVRSGDTVVVPHGYHGPSVAAPGHDMYYLNVMAGPAEDASWMMRDDPAHTWQRQSWENEEIDPRLPFMPLTKENL
ncbi:5-deoxy-glucuronate isomerase [Arcanobacterium hippocoleae]|uniref:5-deoxy-glucuronate isomerase n=1 Tax=Arcanobacterium hippocoleae TaxID=149017 RepID=A0ABU1T4G6_9ACTO|nr:5-deoxy-glucuronate isomerase [Arcanobacterium hippocoleae]MDR6939766.1 5-deoxy-glucuronate isomerase [Arcanobacterium hippocoleae]